MATLSASSLVELRQKISTNFGSVDFDKGTVNAALQAIEDLIEDNRPLISACIDSATAPYTFSNPDKKKLVAYYFRQKATRDGV